MVRVATCALFVVFVSAIYIPVAFGIAVGQVDDFNSGTLGTDTFGWIVNAGPLGMTPPAEPPTNIATGGPAGIGDRFLQLTSTGILAPQSPGARMTAFNLAQWSGDYTAAGVVRITMDVNNLGDSDFGNNLLHLRLLLGDLNATFDAFDNFAVSTSAVVLAPSSGWQNVAFDISEADLTLQFGSIAAALGGVDVLRVFHNTAAAFPGPPSGIPAIEGLLGVDNITAVSAVPLPPALALFATGLVALWRHRRAA